MIVSAGIELQAKKKKLLPCDETGFSNRLLSLLTNRLINVSVDSSNVRLEILRARLCCVNEAREARRHLRLHEWMELPNTHMRSIEIGSVKLTFIADKNLSNLCRFYLVFLWINWPRHRLIAEINKVWFSARAKLRKVGEGRARQISAVQVWERIRPCKYKCWNWL